MDRDIEKLLRKMSRIFRADPYDPVVCILLTNKLLPLKKEGVLNTIDEFATAQPSIDSITMMLLLRVLFNVPKDPGYMPPMIVGEIYPPNLPDETRVPRYPIILHKDIPLLILSSWFVAGGMEPVSSHIKYYRKQCTLRDAPLKPPRGAGSLLPEIKASPQWITTRDEDSITRQLQSVQKHFG